jgi:hypothetical protein
VAAGEKFGAIRQPVLVVRDGGEKDLMQRTLR